MIRVLILLLWAGMAHAQVRVDPAQSQVSDGWGTLRVELGLSGFVPYRVFTLDEPRRLVVDFDGLVWDDVDPVALLDVGRATDLRFGPLHDGWSRLVIDLDVPLTVAEAGMIAVDDDAALTIVMEKTDAAAFAADAGTPDDVLPAIMMPTPVSDGLVVVIDPGHGGIDPGADRGGVQEAPLMLNLAREVAVAIDQIPDVRAVLTRDGDVFVPLETRLTIARAVGADLFISLHADALALDEARGASVYTLSSKGADSASSRTAAWHNQGDLLSGLDLTGQGDRVSTALMDLARQATGPAGDAFADQLVVAMDAQGVVLNSNPRRSGPFAVLMAADFPSVLIEAGFLSSAADRAMLADPTTRAPLVRGVQQAVAAWAQAR